MNGLKQAKRLVPGPVIHATPIRIVTGATNWLKTAIFKGAEMIIDRKEQLRRAYQRYKARRQAKAGIFPMWKAVAVIDGAMQAGATFDEAKDALFEILSEQGLKLRADIR